MYTVKLSTGFGTDFIYPVKADDADMAITIAKQQFDREVETGEIDKEDAEDILCISVKSPGMMGYVIYECKSLF